MVLYRLLETSCFILLFYHLASFSLLYSRDSSLTCTEVQLPSSADTFTNQMGQAVFYSSTCSSFRVRMWLNGCEHLYKYCLYYSLSPHLQMILSFHIARVDCIKKQPRQTTHGLLELKTTASLTFIILSATKTWA